MPLLEMRGIQKRFGPVHANRGIDLAAKAGSILGLLGENGSGKSTLMKILLGIVSADAGEIVYKSKKIVGHSPAGAAALGIGMIHQHFTLIEAMSVAENIMLGSARRGGVLRRRAESARVRETNRRYGLDTAPEARIRDLSLGQRQRVEIMRTLLRGDDLLVLDEPTSNLSPPEIDALIVMLRKLRDEGKAIIFISHKLAEVCALCDEVVVLRDGAVVGSGRVADTTPAELGEMIVGRKMPPMAAPPRGARGADLLIVDGLSVRDERGRMRLSGVSFALQAGEILAIAGIDGNGQQELAHALAGLVRAAEGSIVIAGADATAWTATRRLAAGLAYIPADRAETSLVQDMTVAENTVFRDVRRPPLSCLGFVRWSRAAALAGARMAAYGVRAAGRNAVMRTLSGGNQQKVALAREMGRNPRVMVAHQATWGLDPASTRFVLEQMLALRDAGGAVIFISSELEEILRLGTRVGVLFGGKLVADMPREAVDLAQLGLLMAGGLPKTAAAA